MNGRNTGRIGLNGHRGRSRRAVPESSKLAAIDIGSNSIHMVTALVRTGGHFEIIDRAKEMVGLGRGTLINGRLSAEALEAGFRTLAAFTQLARRQGAEPILAVATAAIREADNGGELVLRAGEELGLRVDVITGAEEARLVFEAARHSIDFRGHRALVVDIGGGSVELIQGIGSRPEWQESLKLGVARLTDRFIHSDPPRKSEITAVRNHIARKLAPAFKRAKRVEPTLMAGTSGTLHNLTAMAAARRNGYIPVNLHNYVLHRADLAEMTASIIKQNADQRAHWIGLDRRRVDLIVAGALLTEALLEGFHMEEMRACEWGLREGIILDFLANSPGYGETAGGAPDIRSRSVFQMARRFGADESHARHVAGLAIRLFNATREIHRLGPREREILEYAAMLHDVGLFVSHARHHHHSEYLINHGELLRGFTPEEVQTLAVLARFHKGPPPKTQSPELSELSYSTRGKVVALAAILRIADALDRSHHGIVRTIRVSRLRKRLRLWLDTGGNDVELELWAVRRKCDLWEKQFGYQLEFQVAKSPRQDADDRIAAHARDAHNRYG
ncbi:MAG: HD domain-containing protein [Candidatus Binataceae bacterium]